MTSYVDDQLSVLADNNMVSFIIRNLLSNAIKFTPEGGKVNLTSESRENDVFLTVEDNGVGISAKNLEKLFNVEKTLRPRARQKKKEQE